MVRFALLSVGCLALFAAFHVPGWGAVLGGLVVLGAMPRRRGPAVLA